MDINSIISKAKDLASLAGRKTSNAMEISKLNLQSVQINTMIQSTYERIGSLYFCQSKTNKDNTGLMQICIAEVDSLLLELANINSRIANLKNGTICDKCGTANPIESMYCAKCGANLKIDTTTAK